jgi:hypothetical protein
MADSVHDAQTLSLQSSKRDPDNFGKQWLCASGSACRMSPLIASLTPSRCIIVVPPVVWTSARLDDDLPVEVPCIASVKRCRGSFQREGTPDGDCQRPLFEERDDVPERGTTLIASSTGKDLDSGVGGIKRDQSQDAIGPTGEFN